MASIGCTHTTGWTTLWTEILLLKLHLKQRGPVFWFAEHQKESNSTLSQA